MDRKFTDDIDLTVEKYLFKCFMALRFYSTKNLHPKTNKRLCQKALNTQGCYLYLKSFTLY